MLCHTTCVELHPRLSGVVCSVSHFVCVFVVYSGLSKQGESGCQPDVVSKVSFVVEERFGEKLIEYVTLP